MLAAETVRRVEMGAGSRRAETALSESRIESAVMVVEYMDDLGKLVKVLAGAIPLD